MAMVVVCVLVSECRVVNIDLTEMGTVKNQTNVLSH